MRTRRKRTRKSREKKEKERRADRGRRRGVEGGEGRRNEKGAPLFDPFLTLNDAAVSRVIPATHLLCRLLSITIRRLPLSIICHPCHLFSLLTAICHHPSPATVRHLSPLSFIFLVNCYLSPSVAGHCLSSVSPVIYFPCRLLSVNIRRPRPSVICHPRHLFHLSIAIRVRKCPQKQRLIFSDIHPPSFHSHHNI